MKGRKTTVLTRFCPVCLNDSGYILGTLNYEMLDNSPIASRFKVVACTECGLVTSNTPSTQAEYDRYYAERGDPRTYKDIISEPGNLFHVLEHLVDVEAAIKHIRNDGLGLVCVEVPDTVHFTYCAADKSLSYFYYTHLLHLDSLHLQNLFTSKGFHCTSWEFREYQGIPSVGAVFVRGVKQAYTPDFFLAERVADWFDETSLDPTGEIEALRQSGRPVYVWGIGLHASMYLGMSPLKDCNIRALVDKDPALHGRVMAGHKVQPAAFLTEYGGFLCEWDIGPDDTVFITTVVHQKSMREHLAEIGFTGQVLAI